MDGLGEGGGEVRITNLMRTRKELNDDGNDCLFLLPSICFCLVNSTLHDDNELFIRLYCCIDHEAQLL
jgi:hypothetical protein